MNFSKITKTLSELKSISSNNEKMEFLKNHNDKDFKEILSWFLDNSRITGIADKKYEKFSFVQCNVNVESFHDVIEYLDKHNTGKDEDIAWIKAASELLCDSQIEFETFKGLVCKNFPIGVQSKMVNKVFDKLVPTYDVMLADKFYDLNDSQKAKLFNNGKREFVVSEKMDGIRLTIHKVNGTVRCITRQGKLLEGLVDIEKEVENLPFDNFVFDGELLVSDRSNIPSKLQYKATMKLASTKESEKHGLSLNVFDVVNESEWLSQKSDKLYKERYERLSEMLRDCKYLKLVDSIYVGSEISKIDELLAKAKAKDWEGVMVRFSDSKYEWKRSKELLKVKPFKEMDAYITGYEEGINSNQGRLGAFVCEVNHPEFGNLKFKVGGGFSEDERIEFWRNRDELIGRIISVQYFEVTENTTTHQLSVRFPDFLELKEEGSVINN